MALFIFRQGLDSKNSFNIRKFFSHERTIYLYKPLPMSWLTGFFGYLMGNVAEYSNPEKTVGNGEGREGNSK